jgi:hypothetical protein
MHVTFRVDLSQEECDRRGQCCKTISEGHGAVINEGGGGMGDWKKMSTNTTGYSAKYGGTKGGKVRCTHPLVAAAGSSTMAAVGTGVMPVMSPATVPPSENGAGVSTDTLVGG